MFNVNNVSANLRHLGRMHRRVVLNIVWAMMLMQGFAVLLWRGFARLVARVPIRLATFARVRAMLMLVCGRRLPRTVLIGRVGSTDGTDCSVEAFSITRVGDDTLCGNGSDITGMTPDHADCATSLSVQDCVNSPFSTNCEGSDVFDNTREALLEICTNGVVDCQRQFL